MMMMLLILLINDDSTSVDSKYGNDVRVEDDGNYDDYDDDDDDNDDNYDAEASHGRNLNSSDQINMLWFELSKLISSRFRFR